MKKNLHLAKAVAFAAILSSCSTGNTVSEVSLLPMQNGDEYLYINQEGTIMINPQFGYATIFREGLALVKSSGEDSKWGYISEDGKYAVTAKYNEATVFSEGLAWVVADNAAPVAINSKGETKITLQEAESVKIFKDGLAAFSVESEDEVKWGFVDKMGKVVINPQFAAALNFSDGKCAVANKEGKWGFIDKTGKIVINYQFSSAKEFSGGKAVVSTGEKSGVIDESGKYLINPQFNDMLSDGDMFLVEMSEKWGWCDKDGKITINPQFSEAFPFFGSELAAVKSGESYGYIDREGKFVINPQFDFALPFNGKLALVKSSEKVGFVNQEGKYAINPQFDDASSDIFSHMFNGASAFKNSNRGHESVNTDFFNVAAVISRIKKDINEKGVLGMNFNTSMADIRAKYGEIEKYGSTTLISDQKIAKDANLTLHVEGRPWSSHYNYYYSRLDYTFNPSVTPTSFYYSISIRDNVKIREAVLASLKDYFSKGGFTIKSADPKATELEVSSKSMSFIVNVYDNALTIKAKPLTESYASAETVTEVEAYEEEAAYVEEVID